MWEQLLVRRHDAVALARELVEIQAAILAAAPPDGLPQLTERVSRKIDEVEHLTDTERQEAARLIGQLPTGTALCHGDFHPGNVLMAERGPVVIDWFDVTIGHPAADLVRTSLLLRPAGSPPLHLPGASAELLSQVHCHCVDHPFRTGREEPSALRRWEAILAASRLAEGAQSDALELLALWRDRHGSGSTPLLQALSDRGRDEKPN